MKMKNRKLIGRKTFHNSLRSNKMKIKPFNALRLFIICVFANIWTGAYIFRLNVLSLCIGSFLEILHYMEMA